MNVLFVMFAFPDLDKNFNMYTALVEQFNKNGHEVFVIAPDNEKKSTGIRIEKGFNILRVKTLPIKNVNYLLKGISNIFLPIQYFNALNRYFPSVKFDLIISSTPPVTLAGLIKRLKKRHRSETYLILRDIFPQNAVDLGFIRQGGIIHRYFRKKEKELYKVADRIGCMSEGNINYLLLHNKYLSRVKVHILENFQKLNDGYPTRDMSITTKYGVDDKFIVVFGGNMGKPQQLENILALAEECLVHSKVVFLILGEGIQKRKMETEIKRSGIKNVLIIDTVPKVEYQRLISVCDIGLISLHGDFTIPNIPSKTLDYFNLGIPVLASIDRATDFGPYLDKVQAGLWSYAGDLKSFKANFDRLYHDAELRRTMGANGRKYFEDRLTPDKAYETIISHLSMNL